MKDTIAVFGFASGTLNGKNSDDQNHWRIPAAWRAIIVDGRVALWQVYADIKTPYDIIARNA